MSGAADPGVVTAAVDPVLLDDGTDDDVADLFENAPCGYLSCLPDGTILKVNQTFLAWTGHRREDLVGKKRFQDLLSVGGRIYYETHYGPLLRMQGAAREIAVDVVGAGGGRLPALVNSVLSERPGHPARIRTAVFDATSRRSYERELLEARRQAEESEARARLLAQTLQHSLLPPATPLIPGLDVAAVFRPAGRGDEVGGDYYDVFEAGQGDWVIAVGDVRGKGVEAAVVATLARYTLRAAAIRTPHPAKVLETLNEVLLREGDAFCTVLYARVRCEPGKSCQLTVACGGHPLPLLLSPSSPIAPLGRPGTLLGALDRIEVTDVATSLAPGDAVVFFTDGVTEARGPQGFFGEERLVRTLDGMRHKTAAEIAQVLVGTVVTFQNGEPRDDIAVLVIRVPLPGE